jgi:adenosylcobinamide kinase/adenosylcobinamide-phosphate guanylyltransferase
MTGNELVLIIGGARSGKSRLAEQLAAASGRAVLYAATLEPGDDEMVRRISAHRSRRPADWQTIEAPLDLVGALRDEARPGTTVLIDCLTVWISNLLLRQYPAAGAASADAEAAQVTIMAAIDDLLSWYADADVTLIVVSNEVGAGLVPPYPLGRLYRDVLGTVNQRLAAVADRVFSVTAGLALELKGLGARPV